MRREPGFSSDDTLLAVTTLSFDIAGLELYLPLLCGGRVAIAGSAEAQDPRRLMERIRQSACTVLQATPATFRALLDAGWQPSPKLKLLCGGEALLPDLAEALLARCGELWNMYGPTETTVWSALHRVSAAEGPIAIGKPIGNTQLYVLDAHGNLAAPGVPGELYIGGDGLARGYLHREELTAERFVASPSVDGARLYRTGDLARWHRDGTMECLGRVDNQVKLRGFRIELGEVEAVLSAYPGIRQCTVVLAPDAAGGGQLAAYYEPAEFETAGYESQRAGARRARAGDDGRPRAEIPAAELRAHLSKELPPYMVPSVFVALAKLPLTPNGKIDRKVLAASTGELVVEREFVAPRNEIEQLLAQIWARVLKVSRVGMEDNFFELGGHSLLAVRVVLEIEKLCHIRLPLAVLLQSPTVAALAAILAREQGTGTVARPIERRQQQGPAPLSFAQQPLWFLYQFNPASPAYNVLDVARFEGPLAAAALRLAIAELLRRHEILRTCFAEDNGQAVQIVLPSLELELPELDLSQLSPEERERRWRAVVREEGQKPFDLTTAPLLRLRLVHCGAGQRGAEHRLLVNLPHILCDERSMELIQRELHALYDAFSQGRPSPLPELPIQYADFACWQQQSMEDGQLDEPMQAQLDYWKQRAGRRRWSARAARRQAASGGAELPRRNRDLYPARGAGEQLKALGRQEQATLFMTLEAELCRAAHRYTGQDDC